MCYMLFDMFSINDHDNDDDDDDGYRSQHSYNNETENLKQ